LLQNLAKLYFFLEEQVPLCKSDHCFIRRKKTANASIYFLYFDFVDDVEFCYTGFMRYTNNN
jgi:hypothetical protein